jgi:hypothetical protein
MRYKFLALGLCIALAGSGCVSGSTLESYQPKNPEEVLVVSMLMRIPNGIKARSLEMMMLPYAEDVYIGNFQKYIGVAGPTAPLSISKRELRDAYNEMFRKSKDISMDVKNFRVTVDGNRAVAEARTELLFKIDAPRGEDREQYFRNDVTWRMRRTPAGWKIVEEIWE